MLSDGQRPLICIPPPLDPLGLQTRFVHGLGNGLATAVDEDRTDADDGHEDDIRQQLLLLFHVIEDAAAEFDDHDSVAKPADVLHGLDQGAGFCNGLFHLFSVSGQTPL